MDKHALRKHIAEKRAVLSDEYLRSAGKVIASKAASSEAFKGAQCVFIYASCKGEPDTYALIKEALAAGKTVLVPKCRKKPHMDAVRIFSEDDLAPGSYGICEPFSDEPYPKDRIDLAVIPCVSAGLNGRRLGHGGGYYDVFLKDTKAVKMCLCFKELLSDDIPAEQHDVQMDLVITD